MGYVKHHTIIVTGWNLEKVEKVRKKAQSIFDKNLSEKMYNIEGSRIISEIITGLSNGQYSFFIAPDGSKEGWECSDNADNSRDKLTEWLDKNKNYYCEYVELYFGGDDSDCKILRTNNEMYL